MNQSTIIAGCLFATFVLFLAANNRLSAYTAVLWGNTALPNPGATAATSPAIGGSDGNPAGAAALNVGVNLLTNLLLA